MAATRVYINIASGRVYCQRMGRSPTQEEAIAAYSRETGRREMGGKGL